MEMEASDSVPSTSYDPARAEKKRRGRRGEKLDGVHVKRETLQLQALLEQCQRALESLKSTVGSAEPHDDGDGSSFHGSSGGDAQVAQLCDLLKCRVESPDFLEKLGSIHLPVSPKVAEAEDCSWDLIDKSDLWEDFHDDGDNESDKDGYVLVKQEDAMEGIACFMAAYLLSLKETKDLTPDQLQEALSKTLSVKKKKGKLRKAWDGSIVIYNVASWSATAIGIYQNPTLLRAASEVFWTSCRLISKLM